MWYAFRTDGFDDAELNKFIRGAVNTGDVNHMAELSCTLWLTRRCR